MKILNYLEEGLIALLMASATVITFVSVVYRYCAGIPIDIIQDALLKIDMSWTQELTIYLFVWMAKFGAAYGVRVGIHVGVDILINQLSSAWQHVLIIIGLLAGAIFTGVVGGLGTYFVWQIAQAGSYSVDLEIPMWIVYLAVPLGSFLMCYRFLQVVVTVLRGGELPHHDHGHVPGITEEGRA